MVEADWAGAWGVFFQDQADSSSELAVFDDIRRLEPEKEREPPFEQGISKETRRLERVLRSTEARNMSDARRLSSISSHACSTPDPAPSARPWRIGNRLRSKKSGDRNTRRAINESVRLQDHFRAADNMFGERLHL